MSTIEIVLLIIFCILILPLIAFLFANNFFIKDKVSYVVYYKSINTIVCISDVIKIKFKKDFVYIKSYDFNKKYYSLRIIKKENFRQAEEIFR